MRLYGKRNEKKLPVAHEIMLYLREKYWINTDWVSQIDQKLTWIGIAVAMDCLLRISEFALCQTLIICNDLGTWLSSCRMSP
jgi:hypothetical protein